MPRGTQYGCAHNIVLGTRSPNGNLAPSSVLCWYMYHVTTSRTLVAAQRLGWDHLFVKARRYSKSPSHPEEARPRLRITSCHTLRRPLAHRAATRLPACVRVKWRTRCFRAVLPTGRRLPTRSARSMARSFFRSQAQYFSTGLRSGERGGVRQGFVHIPPVVREEKARAPKTLLLCGRIRTMLYFGWPLFHRLLLVGGQEALELGLSLGPRLNKTITIRSTDAGHHGLNRLLASAIPHSLDAASQGQGAQASDTSDALSVAHHVAYKARAKSSAIWRYTLRTKPTSALLKFLDK